MMVQYKAPDDDLFDFPADCTTLRAERDSILKGEADSSDVKTQERRTVCWRR